MQKLLLLSFFVALQWVAVGQINVCIPDPSYQDSAAGVYPPPYSATLSPDGGINTSACINKPYQFSIVIIADTLNLNGIPLPLDSIVVSSITGMPAGLNYACNPSGCNFKKQQPGCAVLYGTPATSNMPGDYNLVITGVAYYPGGSLPLTVPTPFIPALSGTYTLKLVDENSPDCFVYTSTNEPIEFENFTVSPNPFQGNIVFKIETSQSDDYLFRLFNATGQEVHRVKTRMTTGENTLDIDASSFDKGMYIYEFRTAKGIKTGKLIKQ